MITKYIPRIKSDNNLSGRLWMHLLLTIVGFIGSYIIIFWIGVQTSRSTKSAILELLTNPIYFTILCTFCTICLNILYIFKNYKKININSIQINDGDDFLVINVQGYYSNKTDEHNCEKKDIKIEKKQKKQFLSSIIATEYYFYSKGKLIGIIDNSDIYWEKEHLMIKEILKYFNYYSI